ncbi:MAG: hypothetical protein IMY67_11205 [Bacteroidetes bacterium]|nr:hypothetical protein [Bacteroidota bacterium]
MGLAILLLEDALTQQQFSLSSAKRRLDKEVYTNEAQKELLEKAIINLSEYVKELEAAIEVLKKITI